MKVSLFPTTPTKATTFTMKRFSLFMLMIEKVAFFTEIRCKLNSTFFAILLWLLNMFTLQAFYLFNFKPVHFVLIQVIYLQIFHLIGEVFVLPLLDTRNAVVFLAFQTVVESIIYDDLQLTAIAADLFVVCWFGPCKLLCVTF